MKPTAEIRILVVEDDPFFQRVLQKRLSSEGYQVMAASDGREGMKAIVSFEPDVVLSDWILFPGRRGALTACRSNSIHTS